MSFFLIVVLPTLLLAAFGIWLFFRKEEPETIHYCLLCTNSFKGPSSLDLSEECTYSHIRDEDPKPYAPRARATRKVVSLCDYRKSQY